MMSVYNGVAKVSKDRVLVTGVRNAVSPSAQDTDVVPREQASSDPDSCAYSWRKGRRLWWSTTTGQAFRRL